MKKEKIKNGLMLFAFFFKIGCFTFGGGWSILAQMEQERGKEKKNYRIKKEPIQNCIGRVERRYI